ncbi:MAG: nucleoside diphosphate kinase regulator [Kofleriaceae bacterium]
MQSLHPQPIIIGDADKQRLLRVLDEHDPMAFESLDAELYRANIIPQADVPPDVVTMNSEVVYEDIDTFVRRNVRLVYPKDADPKHGRISVLAPIGSALLGLRIGQTIDWNVPTGRKRVRVVELHYQPEACGDFHL